MRTAVVIAIAMCTASGLGCEDGASRSQRRVLATNQSFPYTMLATDDALFWGGQTAMQVSLDDATANVIGTPNAGALAMAHNSERLFWATSSEIWSAARAGGEPELISSDHRCVFAMAADETRVYWASVLGDTILAWDAVTGEQLVIADDQPSPRALEISDGRLYWATGAGTIASADRDGDDRHTVAEQDSWPADLVVVGDDIYWATSDGAVVHATAAGGDAETIAQGDPIRGFGAVLAVDGDGIYWATRETEDAPGQVRFAWHGTAQSITVAVEPAAAIAARNGSLYVGTTEGEIVELGY